jgi:hypothetical protein
MIKLNKNKTKALRVRWYWTNYIYWIPTIQTDLHIAPDGFLTVLFEEGKRDKIGSHLGVSFYILGLTIHFNYWWNLKEIE